MRILSKVVRVAVLPLVLAAVAGCPGGSSGGSEDTSGPGPDVADAVGDDSPVDASEGPVVLPAHCSNLLRDEDETDKDCGGSCDGCLYQQKCKEGPDCASGWCVKDLCAIPTCKDDLLGPSETDVDCGGTCPRCKDGRDCKVMGDCESGKCVFGTCEPAACDDLLKNGDESAVDCGGGTCKACDDGRACNRPGDCKSRNCVELVCRSCGAPSECPGNDDPCRQRTCTAGVCDLESIADGEPASTQVAGDCRKLFCTADGSTREENDDTDIVDDRNQCTSDTCDAGTPLHEKVEAGTPCVAGVGRFCDKVGLCVQCLTDEDCPGQVCTVGRCVAASCADGKPNGDETGKDCGGPTCMKRCAGGEACKEDGDCASNLCDTLVCTDAACDDDRWNGDETAQDCGGPDCTPCDAGLSCELDRDCVSGRCSNLVCIECLIADDCPASANECLVAVCNPDWSCGFGSATIGTEPTTQPAGDCKTVVCDGEGGTFQKITPSDVPVDGKECTDDVCTDGLPSNQPKLPGTPCMQNGGTACDSNGNCI